jgi:hypothetical protein
VTTAQKYLSGCHSIKGVKWRDADMKCKGHVREVIAHFASPARSSKSWQEYLLVTTDEERSGRGQ